MNNPLVSVVIPVLNGEKYLDSAITSIINQSYDNQEIILIDGHSQDNTAKIAQSYDQVRYFLQTDTGIANAYNQGIELAQGEFITFLTNDDLWHSDKLKLQVEYLLAHPAIQYTVTKVKFFLEEGYACPPGLRKELLLEDKICKIMETLVARKQLFSLIGKLNPEYKIAVDVDWFARCHDANVPMAIIDETLLYRRIHDCNLSLNVTQNNRDLLKLLRNSIQRKRKLQKQKDEQ